MAKASKDKEKASGPRARNDAYVMMLFITFLAIVGGTVLMYLDHDEYGKTPPPKEKAYAAPKLGDASAGGAVSGGGTGGGTDTKAGSDTPPKTMP
jgi:hypothetical protein